MPIAHSFLKPSWFEKTLAGIHLFGVVPVLEVLVQRDEEAARIAGSEPWMLGLRVGGDFAVTLDYRGDRELHVLDHLEPSCSIVLTFLTPSHLNRTFQKSGPVAPPFTLRGLFRLDVAKKFEALMERAEAFLKPDGAEAGQTDLRAAMLLRLAPGAVRALTLCDRAVQEQIDHVPRGLANLRIGSADGPQIWIDTRENPWRTGSGAPPDPPDVVIEFQDPSVAIAAFDAQLDAGVAVGNGQIRIEGWIPLADALNHLLEQLQPYLLGDA